MSSAACFTQRAPREFQFSQIVKVAQKRHKDMNKLKYLMTLLINNALPL
ncbi:hypothetical protein ACUOA8_18200, partial [Escherichia sp. SS-MK2]